VHCFASPQAESAFLDDVTLSFPVGRVQMGVWLDRYAQLYRRCDSRNGDLLRHVSTADTARDLNLLRRAVGDRRLSYYGFSYGTFLGATYANLFPRRVRAMALDANLDPTAYVAREIEADGGRFLSTDLRMGSDVSSAATLDAFLDLCGAADPAHCAFTAGSPEATRAKIGQAFAIRCSESPNPGPAAFPSLDAFAYGRAGPLGPYWSWTSAACASWRAKAADLYRGPWDRRTAEPVLVVNNTYDPASPYPAAVAMSRELDRARLLTVDGYGHIVGNRSACATRYVNRYLIRIKLPPAGTRCRQDRQPFSLGP
jgi:pimeloyl-ACP methyl ester carboxylesterase